MADEATDPKAELAKCREENLRLRDRLIGLEAELGSARGRLVELEDRAIRSSNALRRLQAVIPGALLILLARLKNWRA